MPFSARTVEARDNIPEVFQGNAVKVLEKAYVSNMIGLLEQLNSVSKYASEVFADILRDTEKNSMRIKECKSRISRIDSKVAPIEKMFVERAPSYFYDNPFTGSEWKRRDALKGLIFRRDRSSMEVNRRRNEADPPPNLSALDNYSKQPCIKLFTDSNFFMNEWMEAEKKKIELEKAKRKARKKRKKKKRTEKKTIDKIKTKKFDPVTGKRIDDSKDGNERVVTQYTLTGDVHAKDIEYGGPDAPPPNPMGKGGPPSNPMQKGGGGPPMNPMKKGGGAPPPNPMGKRREPLQKMDDQKVDIDSLKSGPPVFNPAGPPTNPMKKGGGPAPPPNPYAENAAPPPNPYAAGPDDYDEPPQKLTGVQMALMSQSRAQQSGAFASRPKKPALSGMKSVLLLNQIKVGTKLRVAAAPVKREVPKDKRSMLMASLRGGNKNLKKAAPKKKIEEKKPANEGIFAILNRRQFLADSDSEEEASDDSEWDD